MMVKVQSPEVMTYLPARMCGAINPDNGGVCTVDKYKHRRKRHIAGWKNSDGVWMRLEVGGVWDKTSTPKDFFAELGL